eukprot:TRINITY_DN4454_c0_g1_i1.p1 TRINITY_DN4454_c0_g1~~TRINITY_DN4454_c0_g1_i1.p1  ORF type:complete len:383 (+),score=98.34 TRINITY_DN4454_c0_g1_i1:57-1205(+)
MLEKIVKDKETLINYTLNVSEENIILNASSYISFNKNKKWSINLDESNFRHNIPSIKQEFTWMMFKTIIEKMFKGDCDSTFSNDSSKENLKIECEDKMINLLMGKIEINMTADKEKTYIGELDRLEEKYNNENIELSISDKLEDFPILIGILRSLTIEKKEKEEYYNNEINSIKKELKIQNERIKLLEDSVRGESVKKNSFIHKRGDLKAIPRAPTKIPTEHVAIEKKNELAKLDKTNNKYLISKTSNTLWNCNLSTNKLNFFKKVQAKIEVVNYNKDDFSGLMFGVFRYDEFDTDNQIYGLNGIQMSMECNKYGAYGNNTSFHRVGNIFWLTVDFDEDTFTVENGPNKCNFPLKRYFGNDDICFSICMYYSSTISVEFFID